MFKDPDTDTLLAQKWDVMSNEKGDLVTRTEEYARWTLPYICPREGSEGQEQDKAAVAIGPRLVNHLGNKIVDTMFPHDRPFFAVTLTPEARKKLKEELGEEAEATFAENARTETAAVEQTAMRKLKLTAYRPKAVEAVKNLIISGNVLIRRLKDGQRIVYGIKDFCVRRDIDGNVKEALLKDAKKFGGLPADVKQRVKNVDKNIRDTDDVDLYTYYCFENGRWSTWQEAAGIKIDKGTKFKPEDVPILCLVWNLARGDNYGRGLVEDHASAFHQIDVLTEAAIDMAGVMADVKFLVDPSSTLDPVELNQSPRGSYHQGRKDDITTPEGARRLEIGVIREMIMALERELAQAFLLNSSSVRDAERVTAEEIRFIAMELESAFGGLYSRLALDWQNHEAVYAVSQINFPMDLPGSNLTAFEVVVTTGLESLSREGQLDNLRRALADLQMLETIPEDLRAAFNAEKFASFIFTNHAVNYKEFLYTADEMQANREADIQHQERLLGMQANANVQEEAGKKVVQES